MMDKRNQVAGKSLKLSVTTLAIMNITAVVSLRGLPSEAIYGLSSAFYYLFAAVVFLIPTAMVAAELAAAQLYALRTARLELIAADLGDGVYGAGLESALREIDDIEREYLELFYGRRIVTTKQYRFYVPVKPAEFEAVEPVVVPEGVDPALLPAQPEPKMLPASYVVARFAENSGIVDNDDLSGEIILLTITPTEMQYPDSYVSVKGKDKGVEMVQFRYANNAEVTLSLGHVVISERVLPIYEFGRTVTLLNPTR
jgi:hypothetical protein